MVADLPSGRTLRLVRGGATLEVAAAGGRLLVRREAPGLPPFERSGPVAAEASEALLFADGPLVELFRGGATVTAVLPGEGPARIA